ncbi:cytochrome c oxidase subunit II [Cerasicoccus maritimus]|uniref:cytochrome c oxidase subunit II n=1 Tax=Cerasicoccus maritimus TaxID=490089 RepID=UPI00285285C3|nr:cytochrome c oxidase subunit II [Cerasicoccus maritimus]
MTRYPRFRRLFSRLGFLLMCLWITGCSITTPQSSLDPKGPVAQKQLELFMITVWVCTLIFVLVGGALVWVVWRFREKPGDENKPMPSQGHGNPLIEIGLIGASIAFLVVIAVPTLRAIWFTHDLPEDQPYYQESKLGAYMDRGLISPEEKDNVLEITVRGWQWWFSFEYPQLGITTANEFVIPKGKVVKFNLRGYDVIHSFWLPKLGGKVDIVPGRKNWMWLMAEEEGYYFGQCAEYCGEAHAYMLFRAEVVSDEEFNDWIASYKEGAPAPAGFQMEPTDETPEPTNQDNWMAWSMANAKDPQSLLTGDPSKDAITAGAQHFFGKGKCMVCHAIDGSPAAGPSAPNLTKLGERKSIAAGILNQYTEDGGLDAEKQRENIFEWISKSHFYKPGNLMYERMDAGLIDYKYSGLTYGAMSEIGLTDKDLTSAGVSKEQLAELKEDPNAAITAVVSNQLTLRHIVERIEDNPEMMDKLASVSGWLTQKEFHELTAFLQSLK